MSKPSNQLNSLRSALLGCACLVTLGLTVPTAANADPLTISGPSPFGGCNIAGEPGTNYLNAEVEPWVDVSPANGNNIIAGWQQDRWSNGGSRSLMSAFSKNGGSTWKRVMVPGISKCSGGTGDFAYDRSTDPWVTIAPDGTAYFMSLSFNNDRPDGGGGINAMLVSRSNDNGANWGAPQVLIRDTDGRFFSDKNSMTADPGNSQFVYAVWDRLFDNTLPAGNSAEHRHGDGVANARARRIQNKGGNTFNTNSFTGPVYFNRTTNGGLSWEPTARMILDTGPNAQTINNLIVVSPSGINGTVMDFFTHIYHNGDVTIGLLKSTDHGATFGPEQTALPIDVTLKGTVTPDAKEPVRDANILFDVAIDRNSGNLYLVWQDGQHQNLDRVSFSMSTNNGVSWSTPVMIAKTPYSTNRLRMQSFVPSVEVAADGRVFVTYYDFRNDVNVGGEFTDYWAISCDPSLPGTDCRLPSGWGNETKLTGSSFDMLNAPVARGHFLGDYQGLVKQGSGVRAVFGVAVGHNENEMVTSFIP